MSSIVLAGGVEDGNLNAFKFDPFPRRNAEFRS